MLSELEKTVGRFIQAEGLFDSGGRVLLAVSGGADSTALVHVLTGLREAGELEADFHCVHFNHQLRGGQADEDERFVVELAGQLGLGITVRTIDVRGFAKRGRLSIETAARQLRTEGLIEIAKEQGCSIVVTAHHKGDNCETVIQRLSRGTGFRGLGGIWPLREFVEGIKFARPMLCVGRERIVGYLRQRDLKWRVDHSNADCSFRRNYIRHRLIPALEQECEGAVGELLWGLSRSARRLYEVVSRRADAVWGENCDSEEGVVRLNVAGLAGESPMVQVELIRRALVSIGSGERGLTEQHYERVMELACAEGGKTVELPGRYAARRERGAVVFEQAAGSGGNVERGDESVDPAVPGQTRFGRYAINACIEEVERGKSGDWIGPADSDAEYRYEECFDLETIRLPLTVRYRRAGDRFVPLGMTSEKKVGKFLTAARVSRSVRENVLIVADAEKVIWVCPVRMSEECKVTESTARVLRLRIDE